MVGGAVEAGSRDGGRGRLARPVIRRNPKSPPCSLAELRVYNSPVRSVRAGGGARFGTGLALAIWLLAGQASAERRAPRRPLLTNTEQRVIAAEPGRSLPALRDERSELERAEALQRELRRRDAETERSLAQVQGGPPCAEIRAASRMPLRTRLVLDHERELMVGAALLAMAGLLAVFVRVPYARGLLALPPLLGAAYLGHHAYARVDYARALVREGLRACSAELPPPDLRQSARVTERRAKADALIAAIRRVSSDAELVPSRGDLGLR